MSTTTCLPNNDNNGYKNTTKLGHGIFCYFSVVKVEF